MLVYVLLLLIGEGLGHVRVDESGGDRVAGDASGGKLLGRGFRQRDQAGFAADAMEAQAKGKKSKAA